MATKQVKRPPKRPTVRKNAGPVRDETLLRKLEQVTAELAELREEEQALRDRQIDLMFECRHAGFSLRTIGDSAGISNPRVHATLERYAEE